MYLPPGFDKSVALEAAALVKQAYTQFQRFSKGEPWSLEGNYDTLGLLSAKPEGLFHRKEPFGFVARNQTTANVFVTFRGTATLEDWLSDFTFPQVAHPWGHAEEGFSHLYAQCSADVKASVQAAGAGSKVFVTGHSLGAALAVLATADLVHSGAAAEVGMYSFAGPRVGDIAFAARFNDRVTARWRVVNTEDIVTTVPIATPTLLRPRSVFGFLLAVAYKLDYQHVGTPVSFTTHKGSIPGNHGMEVYLAALTPASVLPL